MATRKKAIMEQNELCPASVSGLTVQLWGKLLLLGFTRFRSGSVSERERRTLYAWRLFSEGQDLWAESAKQRRDWDLLSLLLSRAESSLYNLLSSTFSFRFRSARTKAVILHLGLWAKWNTLSLIFCCWDLHCRLSTCFRFCFRFILTSYSCLQTVQT
jgi:hypothetical protein